MFARVVSGKKSSGLRLQNIYDEKIDNLIALNSNARSSVIKEDDYLYYQFTEKQGIENSVPYYQKLNVAYVKTQFGEKIYSSNNTNISKEVLEIIKQNKLNFNLNYKEYLW